MRRLLLLVILFTLVTAQSDCDYLSGYTTCYDADGVVQSCCKSTCPTDLSSETCFALVTRNLDSQAVLPHTGSIWHEPPGQSNIDEGTVTIVEGNNFDPVNDNGVQDDDVFFRAIHHDGGSQSKLKISNSGAIYGIYSGDGPNMVARQWMWQEARYTDRVLQSIASFAGLKETNSGVINIVHQAGGQGYDGQNPSFAPQLAHEDIANGVRVLSWAQQEKHDQGQTSSLLTQSSIRDVGFAYEITYQWYNFGPQYVDFMDLPWSGFDAEVTPYTAEGNSDGSWSWTDHTNAFEYEPRDLTERGGWVAFAQEQDENGVAVGIYFAPPPSASWCGVYRYGRVNDPSDIKTYILEVIHWDRCLTEGHILPANGGSYWYRYYVKIDTLKNIAESAQRIQSNIGRGSTQTTSESVQLMLASERLPDGVTLSRADWYALDGCIKDNCLPLFLLKRRSDDVVLVSTSPYAVSSSSTAATDYMGFVGWCTRSPVEGLGNNQMLSSILQDGEFVQFEDAYVIV